MARTNHMGCQRGKRVTLRVKDGQLIDGRFFEQTDKWMWLDTSGGRVKLKRNRIESFAIVGAAGYAQGGRDDRSRMEWIGF